MRSTTHAWRILAATVLGIGVSALSARPHGAASAPPPVDSDVYVFAATAHAGTTLGLLPVMTTTYAFDPSQMCFTEPLPTAAPSPLPSVIPGFVDVPPDETGPCTGVSGGGTFTDLIACSTGLLTVAWNLTEPSGDVARVDATGVVIAGVFAAAAVPGGYADDSSMTGAAAVVGVMLPQLPSNCVSGVLQLQFSAVVVAAYVPGADRAVR